MKGHIRHLRLRRPCSHGWSAGVTGCCTVWAYSSPWGALTGAWRLHTRRANATRVRRSDAACPWRQSEGTTGGRPVGGVDAGVSEGLIPERISEQDIAATRQRVLDAMAQPGQGSGVERGPIILHMEEEPWIPGKSNLLGPILARMIAGGRIPPDGHMDATGYSRGGPDGDRIIGWPQVRGDEHGGSGPAE
jgi:hypothetical protein